MREPVATLVRGQSLLVAAGEVEQVEETDFLSAENLLMRSIECLKWRRPPSWLCCRFL